MNRLARKRILRHILNGTLAVLVALKLFGVIGSWWWVVLPIASMAVLFGKLKVVIKYN